MQARAFIGWMTGLGLGLASSAVAQEVALEASAAAKPSRSYQGVVPGTDHPPAVPAKPNAAANVITWPGFQMLPDGGSRVFIQSTGPVTTSTRTTDGRMFVNLGPARLAHRNNGRSLITRFFNTPVLEASLKVHRGQATLELLLRARVQPAISSEHVTATGYHFVYVDFPPGQYIEGASLAAPASTPPGSGADAQAPSPTPRAPSHLSGEADGRASGSTTNGRGKVEAKGRAKGKLSIGF